MQIFDWPFIWLEGWWDDHRGDRAPDVLDPVDGQVTTAMSSSERRSPCEDGEFGHEAGWVKVKSCHNLCGETILLPYISSDLFELQGVTRQLTISSHLKTPLSLISTICCFGVCTGQNSEWQGWKEAGRLLCASVTQYNTISRSQTLIRSDIDKMKMRDHKRDSKGFRIWQWVVRWMVWVPNGTGLTPQKPLIFGEKMLRLLQFFWGKNSSPIFSKLVRARA